MPETEVVAVVVETKPKDTVPPEPFTCDWAKDGLLRAINGAGNASAGVQEYHIGSRGLKYVDPAKQVGTIGWWNEMVKLFCGPTEGLPAAVTGRDTAFRVIPRDV